MSYSKELRRPINASRLKELISPTDFYIYEGHDIEIRKKTEWKSGGLCPFHSDQKAGSFFISSSTGAFKCFSCGASGGDVIAYIQQRYEITFLESCQKLNDEWGC
jgi:DNA primase